MWKLQDYSSVLAPSADSPRSSSFTGVGCATQVLPVSFFVQTSIITEGFRSLAEGEPVEFYVESGDDGRTKAVQVTGPAGAPPQVGVVHSHLRFSCMGVTFICNSLWS